MGNCEGLLVPDPQGGSHRWKAITTNLWQQHQAYSCVPAFNLHLLPVTLQAQEHNEHKQLRGK